MAESFSFDVVSDFDRQELVNTLDQVIDIYNPSSPMVKVGTSRQVNIEEVKCLMRVVQNLPTLSS